MSHLEEVVMTPALQHLAKVGRSLVGMVLGYALFVFGTIAGRLPFPDLGYHTSSTATLVAAALVIPWAGVIGGVVTAAIAPGRPFLHIIPACVLIALESTWLYVNGISDGPLWFETGAALSLIFGYVAGAAIWAWRGRLVPGRSASLS
jgi:hypothetical protein